MSEHLYLVLARSSSVSPLAFADLAVGDRIAARRVKSAKVDETVGLGLSSTRAVQLPTASSDDGIALRLAAASVVGGVLCELFVSILLLHVRSNDQITEVNL